MAVAWDASVESYRTGTTDPHTWTHTPTGTPRAIVVSAVHGTSTTDHVSSVTYGGVALTRVIRATDTATELGAAELWFLGAAIPSGNQTVSVDLASATTDDIQFVSMSFTADTDCEVLDSDSQSENRANPSVTLSYGGVTGIAVAALYGGGSSPASFTPNGNCTEVQSQDLGAFYAYVLRQTTPGTSDFAIGGTAATDDVAYAALVLAESGDQTLTPTGFGLTTALGTPSVGYDVLLRVGSTASVGAPAFSPKVTPTGFGLATALGTPSVTGDGGETVQPTGFGTTASLGTPAVTVSSTASPTGQAATAGLGTPVVQVDASRVPTGQVATAALGTALPVVTVLPTGQSATTGLGTPAVTVSSTVTPTGFGLTVARGTPTVFGGSTAAPTGFGLVASLGTPVETVSSTVTPTGLAGTTALGTPSVFGGSTVTPSGFGLTAALGTPVVLHDTTVAVTGFALTASVGSPAVTGDAPPATPPPANASPIPTRWQRVRQRPLVVDATPAQQDAVVAVSGFALTARVGTTWQAADATIALAGFGLAADVGRAHAAGMHNPTDAQIVDWLIEALGASL